MHVRRIVIKNGPRYGIDSFSTWTLDYSDNGLLWTEVDQFTMVQGRDNAHIHDFSATGEHRFWRLHYKSGGRLGENLWIEEVEMLERVFEGVARATPQDSVTYTNRGKAYFELGNSTQALEDFEEAARLDPDNVPVYRYRAKAYSDLGQYTKAIQDFDRVIQAVFVDAQTYNERGMAYSEMSQHRRAITDFDGAIRLDPRLAAAYHNRSLSYLNLGRDALAIEDHAVVIRLEPSMAQSYGSDATGSGLETGSFFSGRPGADSNYLLYDGASRAAGNPLSIDSNTAYDFGPGNAKHVRRVTIKNGRVDGIDSSSTWSLDYSDDGSSWTEAGEFDMERGLGNTHTHDFLPTGQHRYWRLHYNSGGTLGGDLWIEEVEMLEEAFPGAIFLNSAP